jgi:hypothetical protein
VSQYGAGFLLALAFSCSAPAGGAESSPRRIDELLRKSGLWAQLEHVQSHVKAAAAHEKVAGAPPPLSEAESARFLAAIDFAYAPPKLRATVAREIERLVPVEDEKTILAWLSSDFGTRITRLEEQAWNLEQSRSMQRDSERILASTSRERLEKCDALNAARTSDPDEAAWTHINMFTAIAYGRAHATRSADTAVAEAMSQAMELQRAQIAAAARPYMRLECAYVYGDLSNLEFERLLDFTQSPAGRRLNAASTSALREALTRGPIEVERYFGRADRLMHRSGLWSHVGHARPLIRGLLLTALALAKPSPQAAPSDDEVARVLAAVDIVYAPGAMREMVSKDLARLLSPEDESQMLAWLASDLGTRITRREDVAADPGQSERLIRELPPILGAISQPRGEVYKRLEKAMGLSEAGASVAIDYELAVAYGLAFAHPEGNPAVVDGMKKKLEVLRPQLAAQFTPMAIAKIAYMCAPLSDAELDLYSRFLESPSAVHYYAARAKALTNAIAHGALELGRVIGEAAGKKPARDL